jgi:hypothetical protein
MKITVHDRLATYLNTQGPQGRQGDKKNAFSKFKVFHYYW